MIGFQIFAMCFWSLWGLATLGYFIAWSWPHHTLVQGGKPYLTRWPLLGGDGERRAPWLLGRCRRNVFVHWIRASDGPLLHNHPYEWCWSLILAGRYSQTRERHGKFLSIKFFDQILGPFSINRIEAEDFHTIRLVSPFVVSLFVTGPKHGRGWGFLHPVKGFVRASGRGSSIRDEELAIGAE